MTRARARSGRSAGRPAGCSRPRPARAASADRGRHVGVRVGVGLHALVRQGQDDVRARGVDVHLLAEAVGCRAGTSGPAPPRRAARPRRRSSAPSRPPASTPRTCRRPPRAAAARRLRACSGPASSSRATATRPARSRSPAAPPVRRHGREAPLAQVGAQRVEGRGHESHVRRRGGRPRPGPSRRACVVTTRARREGPRRPARSTTTVCGLPTGIPTCSTAVAHVPSARSTSSRGGVEREARLVRGDVVARERVVGPAGEEQDRVRRRQAGEVEGESVLLRVAADALERQVVHEGAVASRARRAVTSRPR